MAAFKIGLNECKKGLCSVVACDIRALDLMSHEEALPSPVFLKFSIMQKRPQSCPAANQLVCKNLICWVLVRFRCFCGAQNGSLCCSELLTTPENRCSYTVR